MGMGNYVPPFLNLLRVNGKLVVIGIPAKPLQFPAVSIVFGIIVHNLSCTVILQKQGCENHLTCMALYQKQEQQINFTGITMSRKGIGTLRGPLDLFGNISDSSI